MFLRNIPILELWLLTIVLLLFLMWLIKEVRNICEKPKGFIELTQLIFIFGSWGVFLLVFSYYLFFNSKETIPILSLFLTIVVGFLGTIMGLFFSKEALEEIIKKYELRGVRIFKEKKNLIKVRENLEKLKKEIEKIKK